MTASAIIKNGLLGLGLLGLLAPAAAADGCPCTAIGTYCHYLGPTAPRPRAGFCHGTSTPCSCDTCPGVPGGPACAGCTPSPGPGPSPGPSPSPQPGAYCMHPSDCGDDEVCCLCNCAWGDTTLGTFACNKGHDGKPLPNDKQPQCCGGRFGFDAWCAKAGTASAKHPKCNGTDPSSVPIPANAFYPFGQQHRCVKTSVGCRTGYCDNPTKKKQY